MVVIKREFRSLIQVVIINSRKPTAASMRCQPQFKVEGFIWFAPNSTPNGSLCKILKHF